MLDAPTQETIGNANSEDSWLINAGDERSSYIFESNSNQGVLVDVQSVSDETIDNTTYTRVNTSGIPSYSVIVDQALLNNLNARPRVATDFVNGSPDIVLNDTVSFGQNIGYNSSSENCSTTGGTGYWPPGPGCPQDTDKSALFTQSPTPNAEQCDTGLGAIGYFSNGTSIYDWNDGQSYQGQGVWQHTAANAEIHDLDICLGHAANGDYHHHNWSACLAQQLNDNGDDHSPIYGKAADGYNVHGPWQAASILAVSSWRLRDYDDVNSVSGCGVAGERSCLLVDQYDVSAGTSQASSAGPTTTESITSLSGNSIPAVSGLYFQDYYHDPALVTAGEEYLDEHGGHEHATLGYHYHMPIVENTDGSYSPFFPFTIGPTFKGELDDNAMRSCDAVTGGPGGGPGGGPRAAPNRRKAQSAMPSELNVASEITANEALVAHHHGNHPH